MLFSEGNINPQPTQLYRRVAFQTFCIRESTFSTKTVKLRFILEITHGYFIVSKTAIGVNLACVFNINTSVIYSNFMLLKCSRLIKNKIIQILITTIKVFDGIYWI